MDATINDKLTYLDYQKTDRDDGHQDCRRDHGQVAERLRVPQGQRPSLVDAVDTALAELRADGTLPKISQKYFDADVTQ